MAPVNKPIVFQDPDQSIRLSRGRDSVRGDDSFAKLFGGLTDAAVTGVGLSDQIIQAEIRRDLTDKVDRIQDGFTDPNVTVSQATGLPDGQKPEPEPLPGELETAKKRLATLRNALDQKKLTPTSYYGQVLAETRRIRSRWPGYREQIDNITRDLVGVDPANAIIRQTFKEANEREGRANAQATRDETYLRSLAASGKAPEWMIQKVRNGTTSMDELVFYVAQQEHKIRYAEKALPANDTTTGRDLSAKFLIESQEVDKKVLKSLNAPDGTNNLGEVLFNLGSSGKPIDANTEAAIQTAISATTAGKLALLDEYKKNPDFKHLPLSTFTAIEETIMNREKAYASVLTKEGAAGLAGIEALYSDAIDQKTLRDFKTTLPTDLRLLWILGKEYPELTKEVMSFYNKENIDKKKTLKSYIDTMAKVRVGELSLGDALRGADAELEVDGAPRKDIPRVKKGIIDGIIRSVPSSDQADEVIDRIMPPTGKSFNNIKPGSWHTFYERLVSPENVETLSPLFKSNPAAAKKWGAGIRRHWNDLYRQEMATLEQIAGSDPAFRLDVNEDGTLSIKSFTEITPESSYLGMSASPPEVQDAQRSIDRINRTFLNTQNTLQATGMKEDDGKGLHFALIDDVLRRSDGVLINQIRDAKANYSAFDPEFEQKFSKFFSDLAAGIARELPLTKEPVVTSNPPDEFPYPEVSNFGFRGGNAKGDIERKIEEREAVDRFAALLSDAGLGVVRSEATNEPISVGHTKGAGNTEGASWISQDGYKVFFKESEISVLNDSEEAADFNGAQRILDKVKGIGPPSNYTYTGEEPYLVEPTPLRGTSPEQLTGLAPEGGDPESTSVLPESEIPQFLASIFPVTGELTAIVEAADAFEGGDYGNAVFASLGAIPGSGIATRLAKKGMGLFKAKQIEDLIHRGVQAEKILPQYKDEIAKTVNRYADEVDILADKGAKASPEMVNAVMVTQTKLETAIEQAQKASNKVVTPFRPDVKRATRNPKGDKVGEVVPFLRQDN